MGAVSFDKDAVYIDIGRANYTKKENLDLPRSENADENEDNEDDKSTSSEEKEEYDSDAPAGLLKSLQDVKEGVDQKMKYSSLRLFKGSKAVKAGNKGIADEEEALAAAMKKQRRPAQDVYELADSFRRRFDNEEEGSGSDGESGSDSESSSGDSDDDSDSEEDKDMHNENEHKQAKDREKVEHMM